MKQEKCVLCVTLSSLIILSGCGPKRPLPEPPGKVFKIADVIEQVRDELEESRKRLECSGRDPLIFGKEFELTLHLGVQDTTSKELSVRLPVLPVEGGVQQKTQTENAQTIRLTFDLYDKTGKRPPLGR